MATKLPPLNDIERLSPLVIRILGGNPSKFTLQGTNTYLLGTGPQRILIDTAQGLPPWRASLSTILAREKCTITTVLLTHWHPDHIRGVPDILSLCPDAKVYKHPREHTSESSSSIIPLKHAQIFRAEGVTLRAFHCPGHTDDHAAFVLEEEEQAMFTGDNVLGHGTAVFEDLAVYMRSLHAMRDALGTEGQAYPGHGDVIGRGRERVEEYIAHRAMREREVLGVLGEHRGEGMTAMEVVKVVYRDVPETLHLPAEGGVVQVLRKLEGEGRVSGVEGMWVMRGKAAL